jgi:hypothetical protein
MGHTMTQRTVLAGKYRLVNIPFLRERANRKSDPRSVFYQAILDNDTYEAYEYKVSGISVTVPTFGEGQKPINGRDEILYARRSGHIVDMPG